MDLKTWTSGRCQNFRSKSFLKHVGLLVILMAYTVLGGLIFRRLEYPAMVSKIAYLNETLGRWRWNLIQGIANNSQLVNLAQYVAVELEIYEQILQDAFEAGYSVSKVKQEHELEKWSTLKAVFFSSTVLTTIGYGNIVPETAEGRAFCMIFALIGIPMTLTVIADWGRLFASAVSLLTNRMPPIPVAIRDVTATRKTCAYAFSAVCFLFVYLAVGAAFFVIWEDDWSFFDGFYFCFVTMTTIGFGDLVPKKPKYMLLCTLYILVGLALTSTIIELVRRQYAQSWRQLQALSGPLAENLKKLAENAPGFDVAAFQHDLRRVLTVVTMPKGDPNRREKKQRQKEWEEAVEAVIRDIASGANVKNATATGAPVIRIIIYESSV